jgi:IS4 transposase
MASAGELAALDTQRWEVETALAELKTTQRGPRQVLRSKSPELVAHGRTFWSTTRSAG